MYWYIGCESPSFIPILFCTGCVVSSPKRFRSKGEIKMYRKIRLGRKTIDDKTEKSRINGEINEGIHEV